MYLLVILVPTLALLCLGLQSVRRQREAVTQLSALNLRLLGERLAAVELVVAAQAIDVRGRRPLGTGTGEAYRLVRSRVPFTGAGEALPQELEPVVELVRSNLGGTRFPPRAPSQGTRAPRD